MKWIIAAVAALVLNFKFQILNQFSNSIISNDKIIKASSTPTEEVRKSVVLLDVPFTSQAPFGEWSDLRHQDGCEEAVSLAAWCSVFGDRCSVKNGVIDKIFAKNKIEEIWEWQVENYGGARDTGAEDTAKRIIGGYFKYDGYIVTLLHGYQEIKNELARGNVVIVPVDGRGLNPNYTAPGPERHMILVRGYDDSTGEFITNDAGTRKGEKYRYKYQKLFNAIRDYPTGDHVLITGVEKKMIVILNYSNYSN